MCETVDSHDFSTLAITGALFGLKIAITQMKSLLPNLKSNYLSI